jgi:hypothetical protein
VNYLAREMMNAATAAGGEVVGMGEGVEGIAKQAELNALRAAEQAKNSDESQSNKRKFVPATFNPPAKTRAMENGSSGAPTRDADEINIDDLDDGGGGGDLLGIQQKAVPAAVFGNVTFDSTTAAEMTSKDRPRLGALDRFNT